MVDFKIRKFAGKYEKIDYNFKKFLTEYKNFKDQKRKDEIIEGLTKIWEQDYISPLHLSNIFFLVKYATDLPNLIVILLRKSCSIHQINSDVIRRELILKLKTPHIPLHKKIIKKKSVKFGDNFDRRSFKESPLMSKIVKNFALKNTPGSSEKSDDESIRQRILFKISDTLFSKKKLLFEVCKGYILDKVIDGKEYQLIKRRNMKKIFSDLGIEFSIPEFIVFKELLVWVYQDYWDMERLQKFISELGLKVDIPEGNKHMDYTTLEPNAIRTFNAIIDYMEVKDLTSARDVLDEDDITGIECVGKTKQEVLETITFSQVRASLQNKGIVKYGVELDDSFKTFLEVWPEHDHIMMLRKFTKAVSKIKGSRYFRSFGTAQRNEREELKKMDTNEENVVRLKSQKMRIEFSNKLVEEHLKTRIDKLREKCSLERSKSLENFAGSNLVSNKFDIFLHTIREQSREEFPHEVVLEDPQPKRPDHQDSLYTSLYSGSDNGKVDMDRELGVYEMKRKKFGLHTSIPKSQRTTQKR